MNDSPVHRQIHVGIRCDAHAATGLGHLIRQTALVEELLERGHQVSLFGTSGVPWGTRQAERLGLTFEDVADEELADVCRQRGIGAVMIDGYDIPASTGESFCGAGIGVAAMVDGEFGRHQVADLYVDQNLGSEPGEGGSIWLVGPEYVLLRDVVLRHRGHKTRRAEGEPPRLLVVFGGSDPFGGCPVAVELALATGVPVQVVAIAASPQHRSALEALPLTVGQSLDVVAPQDDLPALAVDCDAAISAAGSTVWEFACLGLPTALVCVTANQVLGYEAAVQEVAVGLGELDALRSDASSRRTAIEALRRMLSESAPREKLRETGRDLVDGGGRRRVADGLGRIAHR